MNKNKIYMVKIIKDQIYEDSVVKIAGIFIKEEDAMQYKNELLQNLLMYETFDIEIFECSLFDCVPKVKKEQLYSVFDFSQYKERKI